MSQQELGVFIQSVCVHGLDLLADLAQVHIEIDHPERVMQADEPSWVARLRKILYHVRAITGWEIGDDVEHVIAPDLRAAFKQMELVWNELPDRDEIYEWYQDYWKREADEIGMYDHPTGYNLFYTFASGISGDDKTRALEQLSMRLHRLGLGYFYSLDYLSQTLNNESHEAMSARLVEIMQRHVIKISDGMESGGITA
ncbi:MAG: hypothetical protein OXI54_04230 [Chloroflexota bacterium]|nr:hypothetical protein [Chloroflexota bacterium]